jgi:hypothetical protein
MNSGQFVTEKAFMFDGRQQTVREIAESIGIKPSTLHKRLKRHDNDIEACVYGDFDANKFIDLTGQVFGRLTATSMVGKDKHGQIKWLCKCECGNEATVIGPSLRKDDGTRSCGCLKREMTSAASRTHGMSKTPIHAIWHSMMQRCHDKNSHAYIRYGARGITVCDRWHDFENFYADIGDKPEGMSLERGDNDGPYSPENVEWATAKAQANNRRSNVKYKYGDEELTIAQWADRGMISVGTLWSRLQRGIPFPICLLNIDLKTLRGRFA